MNQLIIYSNHSTKSFNHSVKDTLINTYATLGDDVILRDLYKMNFNPVLSKSDFEALHNGNIPKDIATEQEYIRRADVLTFVYPVWWTGMPAILKGYIDRVFLYGFAYINGQNGIEPLLTGKKASVFCSMGQSKEDYEKNGMFEAIRLTTDQGIFSFCGIQVLNHSFFSSIIVADDHLLQTYLDEVRETAKRISKRQWIHLAKK